MTVDTNDLHSIDNLIYWIKTKPGDETYTYSDSCGCPLFHYFRDSGLDISTVGHLYYRVNVGATEYIDLPEGWNAIFNASPYTYGGGGDRNVIEQLSGAKVVIVGFNDVIGSE